MKKEDDDLRQEVEDLGLIIGTKEEELWQKVKESTKQRIQRAEDELVVEREVLKIAEDKTKDLKAEEKVSDLTPGKKK